MPEINFPEPTAKWGQSLAEFACDGNGEWYYISYAYPDFFVDRESGGHERSMTFSQGSSPSLCVRGVGWKGDVNTDTPTPPPQITHAGTFGASNPVESWRDRPPML